ncbi:MAG: hypothetical protein EHM40_21775 [Chloroflexi bacterium]|nr:MAG: hypothetical protein EHM40_21775 [Chloroflexota bacterium]
MFDRSSNNLPVPSFLRLVTAVECSVVFAAAVLLFFLPGLAAELWPWTIPSFNSRFVGAVYWAAYLPLILFWFIPRWQPGRLTLWMILTFTTLTMIAMIIHWDAFEWDRLSTFLVFWPLYIFLPINSTIFLVRSKRAGAAKGYDGPASLRIVLLIFALVGGAYGLGQVIAPEALTGFWPWKVDAFHSRIYAAAFVTPAVGAWILSFRRRFAAEYLSMGLNLVAGGFLPILGTLWTDLEVSVERQVNFSSAGTWAFFISFFLTGILGVVLIVSALQRSKKVSARSGTVIL